MRVLSFGIWQGQHAQSHISGLHNLYHSQLQMQHLLQREVSRYLFQVHQNIFTLTMGSSETTTFFKS